MRIGASTLGHLFLASLDESLEVIARSGYRLVEIAPAPPHLYTPGFGQYERRRLRRLLDRLELDCVSVNPLGLDPISPNIELAEVALRQLSANLGLAHDLGAETLVMVPGRRYVLQPAPLEDAYDALRRQVEAMLPQAERLGVAIALENVPGGLLPAGPELRAFVDEVDSPWLGITYDAANSLELEDPTDGVRQASDRLRVAHFSGSWRERWAHAGIRDSEIDVAAFGATLQTIGFCGPTIYEICDTQDPESRLADDLELIESYGWTR